MRRRGRVKRFYSDQAHLRVVGFAFAPGPVVVKDS